MTRLPDVSDDEFPEALADMAQAQMKMYGTILNSTRQVAYAPQVALGAAAMSRGLVRSGKTPKQLGHLLNLRVAAIVGCPL